MFKMALKGLERLIFKNGIPRVDKDNVNGATNRNSKYRSHKKKQNKKSRAMG